MTEAEWDACADPTPMLEFLRGTASDRKLRLFAVACCRKIWPLLPDEGNRAAVKLAERYADGLAEKADLVRAVKSMSMPVWPLGTPAIFNWRLVTRSVAADMTDPRTYVWLTAESTRPELTAVDAAARWAEHGGRFVPAPSQAGLLHEIFGQLPIWPIAVDPSWFAWNDSAIPKLAQSL